MINSMIEFADADAEITERGRVYLDQLRSGGRGSRVVAHAVPTAFVCSFWAL